MLTGILTAVTAGAVSSFISGVSATVAVYTVCKKTSGKGKQKFVATLTPVCRRLPFLPRKTMPLGYMLSREEAKRLLTVGEGHCKLVC